MEVDVVIVGSGPAGLQAAIHSARKKAETLVLGRLENSALWRAEVENYLGVERMEGKDVLRRGREQAERFGASFLEEDVVRLGREDDRFVVLTDNDTEIVAKALVLAPGISRKKLGIPGEKEFLGLGVSYCASCDCNFFKGRRVAVIGGESEAASAAVLLSDYASEVHWVAEDVDVAPPLMEKVEGKGVQLHTPAKPTAVVGEQTVTGLELEDGTSLEVEGVFIELGAMSSTELALEVGVIPDPSGQVRVDGDCRTEVEGVYACGDVTGQPWQLARAVGQGCVAGANAAKFAKKA